MQILIVRGSDGLIDLLAGALLNVGDPDIYKLDLAEAWTAPANDGSDNAAAFDEFRLSLDEAEDVFETGECEEDEEDEECEEDEEDEEDEEAEEV